ncbi:MAG: DedA family protein [Alphaproteobacteria bacterium]|nr:DedA family protein [Alphaproteobacteria bacterium]MDE2042142.1 DedA family protein [Alphaproteobacteria bacterium]MDE2341169.1 DedA family protein [Alphaproteobacteria bacterium]
MKSFLDVAAFINAHTYLAVWLLMLAEAFAPLIPSEIVLPLSILAVHHGRMSFGGVFATAVGGSMTGALIWYSLARALGMARFGGFLTRYGRFTSVRQHEIDLVQQWIDRYGSIMVFACRVVPLIRSVISIPAGLARMNLPRFVIYSALGCALWSGTLCTISWWATPLIERFHDLVGPAVKLAVATLVLLWLYRVITYKAAPQA